MKIKEKAKDYKCRDCDKKAVAWFPEYQEEAPPEPYCYEHLKKVKDDLIKRITGNGRAN